MTDRTQDPVQEQQPWRLVLDEGDRLEVQPTGESESGRAEVALFMPAWRAADLSRVMDAYSRMAAIFTSISEVSGTESSLARALRDAADAASGGAEVPPGRSKIGGGHRLKAMAVLQDARPELSHSRLVAIIDAAAWWLDEGMDNMAIELLSAVDERIGTAVYCALAGRPAPGQPQPASKR